MKLRNGRFKYQYGYLESIGWQQLKNCIFRFLKEFGIYSTYIKGIKPFMKESITTYDEYYKYRQIMFIPTSYKEFVRREYYAVSRRLFPPGNYWDEIYELWVEWSFEEDKISSKTYIQ